MNGPSVMDIDDINGGVWVWVYMITGFISSTYHRFGLSGIILAVLLLNLLRAIKRMLYS